MSVTLTAAPAFLLFQVGGTVLVEIVTAAVTGAAMAQGTKLVLDGTTNIKEPNKIHLGSDIAQQLLNKQYQTEIMDKDVLLKTLEEHGATRIITHGNTIACDCEDFHLEFSRNNNKSPYNLQLSYNKQFNPEEFIKDLGSEYAINAQEISYNKIKERLEERNLEIEEEEIYEDSTIVLTVNLE